MITIFGCLMKNYNTQQNVSRELDPLAKLFAYRNVERLMSITP